VVLKIAGYRCLSCFPSDIHRGGSMKEQINRLYVKAREAAKRVGKGQTMTEYALILAAIAIVVFVTYEIMGQDIAKLVNNVDSALTTT
jgi:Flp pilus assembly pilin Flp